MRAHGALLPILLLGIPAAYAQDPPLPKHPRLLFNDDGLARLKRRIQEQPWAGQWKAFRNRFDDSLGEAIELPPRGSNWQHWYVCPTHGTQLKTGKQIGKWQWEHICVTGHEVWRGDPKDPSRDFDGCVLDRVHQGYAEAVRSAGILYQVTGDSRYASRARGILLAYAGRYLSYPLHNTGRGEKAPGGRLSPQTLDEAIWLIPATQGEDLIWDTLLETDRKTIADKLLLPAARDVIAPHRFSIPNIQCWENSGIGLVGLLLNDSDLIHTAIDDPKYGYREQMSRGVHSDGSWEEGAWGYHFYTISALWPLVEAARNNGIGLYGEPYRKMFDAPIKFAMPNLVTPAFNDANEHDIRNPLYEIAYARYSDPLALLGLRGLKRDSDYALWFGADQLPSPARDLEATSLRSWNAEESGYAILRRGGDANATWLCVKYGPHGGAHGHPDKNTFILYSGGQTRFTDSGTHRYGSPLHFEWDKTTLAHNTLVVDETSQRPSAGKSLAFGSDKGVDYSMTAAGDIYDGVNFVRTALLLTPNIVVFVDQVEADRPHLFDLAIHYRGKWARPAGSEKPSLPAKEGYGHLTDAGSAESAGDIDLHLSGPGGARAAITLAANGKTLAITANGVGESTEEKIPVAIFRRKASRAVFAWAISLDGAPVKLAAKEETPGVVTVAANSEWRIRVDRNLAKVQVNPGR